MLVNRYFSEIMARVGKVSEQTDAIQQAAKICTQALERGGALHIFDSGHLISHELITRAGGLVALNHLSFALNVNNPVKARGDSSPKKQLTPAYIEHIFETDQLRPGDVLFVGSVSGKSASVVELAQQARAHGLKVIAVTSPEYSSQLVSEHASGKRLYESADLVLDNGAPYGDGMLQVDGLEYPVCPASGIGAAVVMWAGVAAIIEMMLEKGLTPTIYPSVNRPEGRQLVDQVEAAARVKGY